jgi:hypothetical protein
MILIADLENLKVRSFYPKTKALYVYEPFAADDMLR